MSKHGSYANQQSYHGVHAANSNDGQSIVLQRCSPAHCMNTIDDWTLDWPYGIRWERKFIREHLKSFIHILNQWFSNGQNLKLVLVACPTKSVQFYQCAFTHTEHNQEKQNNSSKIPVYLIFFFSHYQRSWSKVIHWYLLLCDWRIFHCLHAYTICLFNLAGFLSILGFAVTCELDRLA